MLLQNKYNTILTFLVLLLSVSLHAQSKWVVSQNGDGNYTTIQEAVDNTVDGDTVFVKSGVYKEHVTIIHSLFLIGENAETTVIDAQDTIKCIQVRIPPPTVGTKGLITNFSLINSGTGYTNNSGNCGIKLHGWHENNWDIINNIF